MKNKLIYSAVTATLIFSGCAGNKAKERMDAREKLVNSSGLICEFVNGDQNPDVEIELNMSMAKRCDVSKNFSVAPYTTPASVRGLIYCCSIPKKEEVKPVAKPVVKPSDTAAKPADSAAKPTEPAKPAEATVKPADSAKPAEPAKPAAPKKVEAPASNDSEVILDGE